MLTKGNGNGNVSNFQVSVAHMKELLAKGDTQSPIEASEENESEQSEEDTQSLYIDKQNMTYEGQRGDTGTRKGRQRCTSRIEGIDVVADGLIANLAAADLIPDLTDDLTNPTDNMSVHIRRREEKGLPPGGFGLLLARGAVDELLYNEIGNEVLLIKYIDRTPPSQSDPLVH